MATHTHSTSGVTVIGIDIGKDIFHLLGFDGAGSVVLRRKINLLRCILLRTGKQILLTQFCDPAAERADADPKIPCYLPLPATARL